MKIENIAGKRIKVSQHSITVKDENGKTAGVVRDTCWFQDLQSNKQIDFWKILRESGVWCADLIGNVVFCDGKMYYLHDLRPLENYERIFGDNPAGWETETKRYNERKAVAENMSRYCMVIPCYIIN